MCSCHLHIFFFFSQNCLPWWENFLESWYWLCLKSQCFCTRKTLLGFYSRKFQSQLFSGFPLANGKCVLSQKYQAKKREKIVFWWKKLTNHKITIMRIAIKSSSSGKLCSLKCEVKEEQGSIYSAATVLCNPPSSTRKLPWGRAFLSSSGSGRQEPPTCPHSGTCICRQQLNLQRERAWGFLFLS